MLCFCLVSLSKHTGIAFGCNDVWSHVANIGRISQKDLCYRYINDKNNVSYASIYIHCVTSLQSSQGSLGSEGLRPVLVNAAGLGYVCQYVQHLSGTDGTRAYAVSAPVTHNHCRRKRCVLRREGDWELWPSQLTRALLWRGNWSWVYFRTVWRLQDLLLNDGFLEFDSQTLKRLVCVLTYLSPTLLRLVQEVEL